jgi:beta-lactamase regulating signal transducer with metallopeptidase domain
MTGAWMLGSAAAAVLAGVAALAADRAAGWFRVPRRLVWAAAMVGSLALPIVALAVPGRLESRARSHQGAAGAHAGVPAGPTQSHAAAQIVGSGAAPAVLARPLPRAVSAAWLACSLAILATFGAARRRVAAACGEMVGARVAGTRVLASDRAGPMVLGLVEPWIVLPRWALDEPARELMLIVRHEREHVAAGDPWLLAASALAVAAVPWNPALWWMHRRLRLAVEIDCDARVLDAGGSRRGYVNALLDAAARAALAGVPAWCASRRELELRLLAITAPRARLRALRAMPLAAIASVAIVAACRAASAGSVRLDVAPGLPDVAAALPPLAAAPADTAIELEGGLGVASSASFTLPAQRGKGSWRWTVMNQDHDLRPFGFDYRYPARGAYPVIESVRAGSPAGRAGIHAGDRVLAVNGRNARQPFSAYKDPFEGYAIRLRHAETGTAETIQFPPVLTLAQGDRRFLAYAECMRDALLARRRTMMTSECRGPALPEDRGAPMASAR